MRIVNALISADSDVRWPCQRVGGGGRQQLKWLVGVKAGSVAEWAFTSTRIQRQPLSAGLGMKLGGFIAGGVSVGLPPSRL